MSKTRQKIKKVLRTKEQIALQEMLREARVRTNQTQEIFAEVLGKPQSFVSKYERGERMLNPIELLIILRNLRVEPTIFIAELDRQIGELGEISDW